MNTKERPRKPNRKDFEIYDEIWSVLNSSDIDEDYVVDSFVRDKCLAKDVVDRILIEVESYKVFVNERLFNGAVIDTKGSIDNYAYEPSCDTVSIKLKYQRNLYSLQTAFDDCTILSNHIFSNMFFVKKLVIGLYGQDGIKIGRKEIKKIVDI